MKNGIEPMQEVDAHAAHEMLAGGDVILIDVRESDEHRREHIPGAVLAPLSAFDPNHVGSQGDGAKYILHCKSGVRSRKAASMLAEAGFGPVYSLAGGIQAWAASGLKTNKDAKAPISIARQVQITVGITSLIGIGLGAFASPWWLILPAFMTGGLLFAGLTDTCGMASVLARCPWNRTNPSPVSCVECEPKTRS